MVFEWYTKSSGVLCVQYLFPALYMIWHTFFRLSLSAPKRSEVFQRCTWCVCTICSCMFGKFSWFTEVFGLSYSASNPGSWSGLTCGSGLTCLTGGTLSSVPSMRFVKHCSILFALPSFSGGFRNPLSHVLSRPMTESPLVETSLNSLFFSWTSIPSRCSRLIRSSYSMLYIRIEAFVEYWNSSGRFTQWNPTSLSYKIMETSYWFVWSPSLIASELLR